MFASALLLKEAAEKRYYIHLSTCRQHGSFRLESNCLFLFKIFLFNIFWVLMRRNETILTYSKSSSFGKSCTGMCSENFWQTSWHSLSTTEERLLSTFAGSFPKRKDNTCFGIALFSVWALGKKDKFVLKRIVTNNPCMHFYTTALVKAVWFLKALFISPWFICTF